MHSAMKTTDGLIDYAAAAERLGVTVRQFREIVARREIAVVRVSHKIRRIAEPDLEAFIERRRAPARWENPGGSK